MQIDFGQLQCLASVARMLGTQLNVFVGRVAKALFLLELAFFGTLTFPRLAIIVIPHTFSRFRDLVKVFV